MSKWFRKIPGYRTLTPWKMILASIVYFFVILFVITAVSTGISSILLLLIIAALIGLIGGLIKPSRFVFWSKKKTRLRAGIGYGILAIIFISLFGATVPADQPAASTHSNDQTAATSIHKEETKKAAPVKAEKKSTSDTAAKKDDNNSSSQAKSDSDSKSKPVSSSSSLPKGLVSATVTEEVDGDTIHVDLKGKDETIRMLLIDTPEDKKPGTPVEPYSLKAASYAASVMPVGSQVKLEIGKEPDRRDHYGRLLAFIYLKNGQLYENNVVRKGLARVAYIEEPNTQHLSTLYKSQSYAKSHKLGIWSIPGYVTDDGYNVGSKTASSSGNSSSSSASSSSGSSNSTTRSSSSTHSSTATSSSSSGGSFQNNPADDKESNTSCKGKIKGNANSKIYHMPGDAYYDRTQDNIVWFCTEAQAQAAGYRHSKR